MLLHYHNPTCENNHPFILHQKYVPLLQSIFISLFSPYLFAKSSLQSLLTLPSSMPQQFFSSLFLRITIPTIYPKTFALPQPFSQFRLHEGTIELGSLARTETVLISPFLQGSQLLIPYRPGSESWCIASSSLRLRCMQSEWHSIQSTFYDTLKLLLLLSYPTNAIPRTHIPQETSWLT